jgi:FkbM family methyltransferase
MKYTLKTPDSLKNQQPIYMQVHASGDLHVSAKIREHGVWEAFESHLVCQLLQPGDCFIDVGANIGYYSVLAAAAVGEDGRVFAFEPEPTNFALLETNIALNGLNQVSSVNAGLAAKNCKAQLYLSDDNWGDHQIYDRGEQRSSTSIELIRGDDYLRNKTEHIDVLKIDTQGAEFQVLTGLEQTVRASLPRLRMIIEFWPFGLKKSGAHGHELLDLLISFELPIWMINHIEHTLHPCSEADLRKWVDALDANPDDEGFFNLLLGHIES